MKFNMSLNNLMNNKEIHCPKCGPEKEHLEEKCSDEGKVLICLNCNQVLYWQIAACGNCKNKWTTGDKYCRYCGAPRGTPVYIFEDFAYIYGPPPEKRTHQCANCNYEWETELMIDDELYCPLCGGDAPPSIANFRDLERLFRKM